MSKAGRITPPMAKQLAEQIRAVGKTAKSEEDLRLNVELAFRHHLTQLGIQTQPSYEQPVTTLKGTGSTNAVYEIWLGGAPPCYNKWTRAEHFTESRENKVLCPVTWGRSQIG